MKACYQKENRSNSSNSFRFQEWPVYKIAIQFCIEVSEIHTPSTKSGYFHLTEQLKRASSSIVLNLAEGYSRCTKKDRLYYLRMSKGSVFECVGALDILKVIDAIDDEKHQELTFLLSEISKMLFAMKNHIDNN